MQEQEDGPVGVRAKEAGGNGASAATEQAGVCEAHAVSEGVMQAEQRARAESRGAGVNGGGAHGAEREDGRRNTEHPSPVRPRIYVHVHTA
jgi:hypothetical protein